MFSFDELKQIHVALHDPRVDSVRVRGFDYPISRVNKPQDAKEFAIVRIGDMNIVTHNVRKPSQWTAWLSNHAAGMITWIIQRRDNSPNVYWGQIMSYDAEGGDEFQVWKYSATRRRERLRESV